MVDIAVAHSSSPRISAYPWSSGFGTKYSNPGTLPPSFGFGLAFSATGSDVAVAHFNSPNVSAYPWSAGFGTKYSDPGTVPAGNGYGVAFSSNTIAVAHSNSPFISTYPWSAGFGSKYSNPGILPAAAGKGVTFSAAGTDVAIVYNSSPHVSVYPWSAGFGTKYSDPGTLAPAGWSVAFSPSGADIAIMFGSSPRIHIYPWSSGFGSKYADPGTVPTGTGRGGGFSPSGADIAVAHLNSPFISTYPWSAGFGSKYSNPGTLPTGTGFQAAFSGAGTDIAVSQAGSPGVTAYPWSSGFGTKYTNPGTIPGGYGYGVAFTPVIAGITFDSASNSTYQTAQSSYSWGHTCTGTDGFLAVDIEILSVPGTTVTALTYNSVAMTLIGVQSTVSGAGRVECWGLKNPSSGSNTIAVTLSASVASAGTAASYTGVHQTSPTEAFNSSQATNVGAADATVSITTIADNCWVHGACVSDDGSITANQTGRNNVTGAIGSGANEDNNAAKTPAGAVTMSYTGVGALATWAIAGYAIRPVAASSLGNRRRRVICGGSD